MRRDAVSWVCISANIHCKPESTDEPAELLAILYPSDGMFEGAARNSHGHCACTDALAVIGIDQVGKPLLKPDGGNRTMSGMTSRSSNKSSPSGMPQRPIVGSRRVIRRPSVSPRTARKPPIPKLLALLVEHSRENQM